MNLDFLSLKAKHQPKDVTMRMYQTDFDKFSKLVEFLNRSKRQEDQIAPEDVFEELMKATDQVEGFSEFAASTKGSRRGRKKLSDEK